MGAGFTARNLHEAGFDWALVIASFNFSALRRQGFTAQQLRTGFGVCPMRKGAGFQIKLLRNAGFKANELSDAGFDVQQLLSAGFNPRQLQKLKRCREDLWLAQDRISSGLETTISCTVKATQVW